MKYQVPIIVFAAASQCWNLLPGAAGIQYVEPKYRKSVPHKRAIFTYGSLHMKAKGDVSDGAFDYV
jgi:hypothetical protein